MIHRIKTMRCVGSDEVVFTQCGLHGRVIDNGDVMRVQTAYDFISVALFDGKTDCHRCIEKGTAR